MNVIHQRDDNNDDKMCHCWCSPTYTSTTENKGESNKKCFRVALKMIRRHPSRFVPFSLVFIQIINVRHIMSNIV